MTDERTNSEGGDLARIHRPAIAPSPDPDPATQQESKLARRKGPTATEREALSHDRHIASLDGHCDYLRGQFSEVVEEKRKLEADLQAVRLENASLQVQVKGLQVASSWGGCLNAVVLTLIAFSSVLLALASTLSLQDWQKYLMLGSGCSLAVICVPLYAAMWWSSRK